MIFSIFSRNKYKRKRQNLYSINFVLKYTILYVRCVDILMWSPTKLDFLFYDFVMF